MLHMVYFSVGRTPLQTLYPTEIILYEDRQKAHALRALLNVLIDCFNSFA